MIDKYLEQRIGEYYKSLATLETEKWVGEFTEDATVEDPPGQTKVQGRDGLTAFFNGINKFFKKLVNTPEFIVTIPPEAVVKWHTDGITARGDIAVRFEGVSHFVFAENGKIAQMRAFWDAEEFARKLKQGKG